MTINLSVFKASAVSACAVAVLSAGATVAVPTSAEAQWRGRGGYVATPYRHHGGFVHRGHRPARGAAIAAGIIGGIAAGALIASAARPAYAAPAYGYHAAPSYGYGYSHGYVGQTYYAPVHTPQYQYVYGGYEHQPTCYWRRVRQVVDYDTVVTRRVRVCH